MHIASFVDIRMFPNRKLLEDTNVQGTEILLNASRQQGVGRFIYCSSAHVVFGFDDIIDATEDTASTPDAFVMGYYSITKCQAEKKVLQANGPTITTLAIRPPAMYGEEDRRMGMFALTWASMGNWYFDLEPEHVHQEHTYVGNAAWVFICAETTLFEEEASKSKLNHNIGGNVFFACDDTPLVTLTELMKPSFEACKLTRFSFKIPPWIYISALYCMLVILTVLKPFLDVNFCIGPKNVYIRTITNSFRYDKAKQLLGYTPLYNADESMKRSVVFYKNEYSAKTAA